MTDIDFIKNFIHTQLHVEIEEISLIYHGINSVLFKILSRDDKTYKVKYYQKKKHDTHDSCRREFDSTSFLWKEGLHNINRPIDIFPKYRIAVYEYLSGRPVLDDSIGKREVDKALDFIHKLAVLRKKESAKHLPIAKEACFSLRAYIEMGDEKLKMIQKASREKPFMQELDQFLNRDFIPLYEAIKSYVIREYGKIKMSVTGSLPFVYRTLNPSDFGFHNSIRYKTNIYFVDFEYFGWDDPTKLVSDTLLHPRGFIPLRYQKYFCKKVVSFFPEDTTLILRLSLLYYLIACKWCLILLNRWIRKCNPHDKKGYIIQLNKAKRLLTRIKKQYMSKKLSFLPNEI